MARLGAEDDSGKGNFALGLHVLTHVEPRVKMIRFTEEMICQVINFKKFEGKPIPSVSPYRL